MTHVLYDPSGNLGARRFRLGGDEARHALRVKRVAEGDVVRVQDGRGGVVECRVACAHKVREGWEIELESVGPWRQVERTRPLVHVVGPAPKGDRLEAMIDALSQCGAASWSALVSERTVVEPRGGKLRRMQRVCEESLKQCGRAWLMEIGEAMEFACVLRAHRGALVIAESSGEPWTDPGMEEYTLLVGPEGGFSERELRDARNVGARVCRFGPHTMRIETAASAACAIMMRSTRA